jgi:glutathione S-transferase
MLRLYDYWESGNCFKVRLLLHQQEREFTCVPLDILQGDTKTSEYQAINPNQKVPLLVWPDGRRLAESNAILFALADGTPWLPEDSWERAQVLQWMFFEQYSHEPNIAVVRFWHFSGTVDQHQQDLPGKMERGHHALQVMEAHLTGRQYFVGERYSIADIALYAYTHVAHEGKFDMSLYPAIQAWLGRVAAQERYIGLEQPVGAASS